MVNDEECEAAGLDIKKVESIARRLKKISGEMSSMGIVLFGGSGNGTLRFDECNGKGRLVVAEIGGTSFDGGDGAAYKDDDGLLRGE